MSEIYIPPTPSTGVTIQQVTEIVDNTVSGYLPLSGGSVSTLTVNGTLTTGLSANQYVKTNGSSVLTTVSSLPYLSTSGGTVSGDVTLNNITVNGSIIPTNVEGGSNIGNNSSGYWQNGYFNFFFMGSSSPSYSSDMTASTCMQGPNDSNYWWLSYGLHTYSDARLKENITPHQTGLDLVNQLRPVTYTWKEGHGDNQENKTKQTHHGFIAQEVGQILPEICGKDKNGIHSSIDYSKLTPILCSAIQQLNSKIIDLQAQVDTLKQAN